MEEKKIEEGDNPKRLKVSQYANKNILAPMVRIGTLPFRLLCLEHGADLVYTQEIIDYKLIRTVRTMNKRLGTIDFINETGAVVFRTCDREKQHVILQIGTNDPDRALKAAKMVEKDVAGIDINMGCPKSFSISGGMGAALLTQPEKITKILTNLKKNLSIPVSCKIRCLSDKDDTVKLAQMIQNTGVDAIGVHGRTKPERPQHPNREDYIAAVSESLIIPVIANGGSSTIQTYDDIVEFKRRTKCSSVMLARAAIKNCAIFRKDSENVPLEKRIESYLKYSVEYDNHVINTKYGIQQMLGPLQELPEGKLLLSSYDMESICKIYNLEEYYNSVQERHKSSDLQCLQSRKTSNPDRNEMIINFQLSNFSEKTYPKNILNRWTRTNELKLPVYTTTTVDKHFHCVVELDGKYYCTPVLEKTKRYAEQSAALVAVISLGLLDDKDILKQSIIDSSNVIPMMELLQDDGTIYLIRINK